MRRLVTALVAAGVLAGCQGDPTPEPSSPSTVSLSRLEGQNGAATPTPSGDAVIAAIPSGAAKAPYYRSEGFWTQDGQVVELREGDRVHLEMTITPRLAGVGTTANQWNVLWQLHGPMQDESWPAPVLTLSVDKGTWRLGGGNGHPDRNRFGAAATKPAFVEGQPVRWTMDITVSTDPQKATVEATMNDAPVATGWHPPGGTIYPGQQWVGLKSGLYAGGQNGASADPRARSVSVEIADLSVTRA